MLNDLLKLEEESLGARTHKLADIYQLMSKTKSEVTTSSEPSQLSRNPSACLKFPINFSQENNFIRSRVPTP